MRRQVGKLDPEKERLWREIIARFTASGLGPTKFCKHESFKPHDLYYWRQAIKQRDSKLQKVALAEQPDSPKEFIPVVVTPHAVRQTGVQPIAIAEIGFLGGSMRLFNGISEETLRSLVQILREMAN